jgi:hypothetical protein
MARKPKNIDGQIFGDVTALEMLTGRDSDGSVQWRCVCACGREFKMSGTRLRNGSVTHCGCKGLKRHEMRYVERPSPPMSPSRRKYSFDEPF